MKQILLTRAALILQEEPVGSGRLMSIDSIIQAGQCLWVSSPRRMTVVVKGGLCDKLVVLFKLKGAERYLLVEDMGNVERSELMTAQP